MKWFLRATAVGLGVVLLAGVLLLYRPPSRQEARSMLPTERGARLTYVALGDSTVAGVGATRPERNYVSRLQERLRTRYPQLALTNLGVSGATAEDVVRDQLPRAVTLQPGLVTLSVGPNDITRGREVEAFARDVERIVQTLQSAAPTVVVANLLPDLALAPRFDLEQKEGVGRQTRRYNEALQRLGQASGAEIVDLYGPSQAEVPLQPEMVASDGYHPSDLGYARWADLFWLAIERRLPR